MIDAMPQDGYPTLPKAPTVPLEKIEWRVDGQPVQKDNGAVSRFVPYIDASIAADLLDDWVGPGRWSDHYEVGTINGNEVMWCHLSIEVAPGVWVVRTDVGKPSNFEGEKGAVSDAFKRAACLKWGVGRNVYDVPGDLWAPCRTYTSNGKSYAAPNKDTIPALIRQLRERGYSAEGVRVGGEGDSADATPDQPSSVDANEAAVRNELLESFGQLPKDTQQKVLERLRKAEAIKRATAGAIGTVAPEHFDMVRRTLAAAHESLRASAGESGTGPASPQQGPVPPPIDGNGEVWTVEQLRDGVEAYRIALSDQQLEEWAAWTAENLGDRDDHEAWMAAYERIAQMVAGGET